MNTSLPPAGWYPDPAGQPLLRWWDGAQWTPYTEPLPQLPAPPPPPLGEAGLAELAPPWAGAEGWYPDPANPGSLRRWSGRSWTNEVQPVPGRGTARYGVTEPPGPPLLPGWFQLGAWLQGLLVAYIAVAFARICEHVWSIAVVRGWHRDESTFDADLAELLNWLDLATVMPALLLMFAITVVIIIWSYRAYRSNHVPAGQRRHTTGWAIAGWLVPFALLVVPPRVVNDIRRAASRRATGHDGSDALVAWWWSAWLATTVVGVAALLMTDAALDPEQPWSKLADLLAVEVLEAGLEILSAVLLILVVRKITALVRRA